MLRLLCVGLTSAALSGASFAQAPPEAALNARTVKVHAILKDGRKVEVRQPDIIDRKLCGWILEEGAAPDVLPRASCIAPGAIASTRVENGKVALAESVDGSLCLILMPLCLAKVAALQDRVVEKAITKAKSQ
jgi:hypothetical protein